MTRPIQSLAALLLVDLNYAWLAMAGERIKTFRGELGEGDVEPGGPDHPAMLALSLIVAALAVLMYGRVTHEVFDAFDGRSARRRSPSA